MGMLARRMIVLSIAAACAGCALVLGYGDPVELGTSSGGPADAHPPDGPEIDAAPGGDAAVDAPAEGSVPYCSTRSPRPTFCASFDGTSYLAEWSSSYTSNARLARDTTTFTSQPASLRIALDRTTDAGVEGDVGIDFEAFKDKPFTATIGFAMRVEAAAPQDALAVVANALVIAAPGGPTYLLQVVCRPLGDGSTVSVGIVEVSVPQGTSTEHGPTQNIAIDQWARIELNVVIGRAGTTGNHVKVLVAGRPGFDGALTMPIGSGIPGLSLGIATVGPLTTAWALRYDDVTFDLH